jgi:hypothetical protein
VLWHDVFSFQVLTELGKVVLEDLLEKLQNLFYLPIIEGVEGHNWEFRNHVAKSHKSLMLIHVKE